MVKRVALLLLICCLFVFAAEAENELKFTENADAIESAVDSVFMLEIYGYDNQKIGVGSGFVAFKDSLLVTNYHVIEGGAYVIAISDEYDRYLVSKVCILDKKNDIAILQFDQENVAKPLDLDTESRLKRAQSVVAIGSPAGLMNTVSLGNISAFYKKDGKDWIQFTAPISSGSSGGPLLNDKGKVIGITTATYASTQNINMAVKAEDVQKLYSNWDGISFTNMNEQGNLVSVASMVEMNVSAEGPIKVYVSGSGKKYHNNPHCSGMQNAREVELLDAIEKGYQPCGKCYK